MRLSKMPSDNMFVLLHPGEFTPVFHKGEDGKIRKLIGGWRGHSTALLNGEESRLFNEDPEVQPVFIPPSPRFD
jgi:hypothetical protein